MTSTGRLVQETLVSFEGMVKRFGSFVAAQRMDLGIRKGEFLAIMGSSGCGKTTTLRMLAGLEVPTGGTIRLSDQPIDHLPTWRRDTPMVWQGLAPFPFLNVGENVEFALRMQGVGKAERRRRAEDWPERMHILEFADRDIAQLSGGQRQRAALARSLVVKPQILLLDEPLAALDAALKVRMQSVLKNLQRETGITFVYVTHSQSEAFSMADRVVIMSRGKVEQIGTPKEIYRTPRTRFVADFLGLSNIFSGTVRQSAAEVVDVETPAGTFRLTSADRAHAPEVGSPVTMTVLDTKTHLSLDRPTGAVNVVPVRLIGEDFVGAVATLCLEAANGQEIRVQKSHEDLNALSLEIGQELFAYREPHEGHLVAEG